MNILIIIYLTIGLIISSISMGYILENNKIISGKHFIVILFFVFFWPLGVGIICGENLVKEEKKYLYRIQSLDDRYKELMEREENG